MKEDIFKLLTVVNQESGNKLVSTDVREYADKIAAHAKIISVYNASALEAFIAYYDNDEKKELAFLTMLVVSGGSRNMGYAKKLLQFSIDNLKELKFKHFRLNVLQENSAAIQLYQSAGFCIIESDGLYYTMELMLI